MTIMAKPAAICQMPATMHVGKMEMAHHTPKNMATRVNQSKGVISLFTTQGKYAHITRE
jgi:hypothetical protein